MSWSNDLCSIGIFTYFFCFFGGGFSILLSRNEFRSEPELFISINQIYDHPGKMSCSHLVGISPLCLGAHIPQDLRICLSKYGKNRNKLS